MFTVIKKPLTPNTLWDSAKGEVLCKFEKGKLETNDEELVAKLKAMGYEVAGEADEPEDDEPQTPSEPEDDKNTDDSDNQNDAEPEMEDAKPKRRSRKAAEK